MYRYIDTHTHTHTHTQTQTHTHTSFFKLLEEASMAPHKVPLSGKGRQMPVKSS